MGALVGDDQRGIKVTQDGEGWSIPPASAQHRRLRMINRGLTGPHQSSSRVVHFHTSAPQPCLVASPAAARRPLTVAFAGVHRSIPRPPAAAGGGGPGGPDHPGGHNWASGFAQLSSEDIRVTAVYDFDSNTREAFLQAWGPTWPGMVLHHNLYSMLESEAPDILCLATAQGLHADHIEAAAAAGVRGIVVEKPLCTTLAEADRIFAAAERHGVKLANGTELRWDRRYMRLAELIADGLVGEVRHITAMGVGDLINHGCHFYDTMLMLTGDPDPVWVRGTVDDVSSLPADDWHRGDPPGHGVVGLSNGVTLTVMPEGGARAFSVVGTKGRLEIVNEARQAWHIAFDDTGASLAPRLVPGVEDDPDYDRKWVRGGELVRDLVAAVQALRPETRTRCDVPEMRKLTEIGFALHASSSKGGALVTLPVAEAERRSIHVDSRRWGNDPR